jgi:hypothetical protein
MQFLKVFFAIVGVSIALAALGVGGREFALRMDSHYAPREEQVRHNTFECSQSHTDGLVHEIRDYQDQYRTADDAGKAIIRQRVLQDSESYTCGDLPSDIQSFIQTIR